MTKPRTQVDTDQLEVRDKRLHRPQRVAVSRLGMVATAHDRATQAGVRILERGGNAIDAAAAAAFALGVCEPAASGLGGQTMVLLHDSAGRQTVALDGSSRAPHRATPGMLGAAERRRGYRSTKRPRICLSNVDGASCPDTWLELMAECLQESFGFEIALNHPFKSGFITRSHAAELPWMQLELSRAPFMENREKRERVSRAFGLFCRRKA